MLTMVNHWSKYLNNEKIEIFQLRLCQSLPSKLLRNTLVVNDSKSLTLIQGLQSRIHQKTNGKHAFLWVTSIHVGYTQTKGSLLLMDIHDVKTQRFKEMLYKPIIQAL